MIELKNGKRFSLSFLEDIDLPQLDDSVGSEALVFSFPEVHPEASLTITFQRTLRIPDDDKEYPLPPGFGSFPLRHVDDYTEKVPQRWIEHGGVMLPMYQSEALWLDFYSSYLQVHRSAYPFAIKVATGKINAVTGDSWSEGLNRNPQDYMVSNEQPWLDGYCVEKGVIRQFVAMPLGAGYSAEEQITGEAEHGGIQIAVYPMKREVFERRFPKQEEEESELFAPVCRMAFAEESEKSSLDFDIGLSPGGRMRQEIYEDRFDLDDWDTENTSRCFVHIANSMVWRSITGNDPPTVPLTAKDYNDAGMPWFDYYNDDGKGLSGSQKLGQMKSVVEKGKEKGDVPLPENESVTPDRIIKLRKNLKRDQVREGRF